MLKSAGEKKEHLHKVSNSKTTNNEPQFKVPLKMTDCDTKQSDSTNTCGRFSRVGYREPKADQALRFKRGLERQRNAACD